MSDATTLEEHYSKLLIFFKWVMQESFEGNDIGGSDAQDEAVELGLARYTPYDPRKHGTSTHCEEGDAWVEIVE